MTSRPPALPPHRLVIGMECHVQLRTRTKAFCACEVVVGDEPNRHVCPTCLGLPGALPVLNRAALEQAIRGGLGLGCDIAAFTRWDRKNYFYPDLPKGFQITQYDQPLCTGGAVVIDSPTRGEVAVRIQRAHLEEDTGKLTHGGDGTAALDFNRCGTPLLEIVTHPDLETAEEASLYLEELRRILRCVAVSDCDMEKGQLRCEPNVNVLVELEEPHPPRGGSPSDGEPTSRRIDAPRGGAVSDGEPTSRRIDASRGGAVPDGEPTSRRIATRIVELKNLNSFAHVRAAIEHERERQVRDLLATGVRGPLPRSTRGWDEAGRRTYLQREKEEAADYRYFPEPDLPPVTIAARLADEIRPTLPELPRARRARYVASFGLSAAEAAVLADDRAFATWFDEAVAAAGGDAAAAKAVANWTLTDVRRELNAAGTAIDAFPLRPQTFGEFVRAVQAGDLPREAAKSAVLPVLAATGRAWQDVAKELGVAAASAEDLRDACAAALAANPAVVAAFRSGRTAVKGVLVGDVMKRTRGTADAKRVSALLDDLLAGA